MWLSDEASFSLRNESISILELVSIVAIFAIAILAECGYGNNDLNSVIVLRGELQNECLGGAMAGAGDMNADGLMDLIVGDTRVVCPVGERRCHVHLGAPHLDSIPDIVIPQAEHDSIPPGTENYCKFGGVVDGGHDINGDGYDDVVITASEWNIGTGKTYLYYGGAPMDDEPDIGLAGVGSSWMTTEWHTLLRGRLAKDLNKDGFDELVCLVGESTCDAGAYIYWGGAPMDSVHDIGIQGQEYPGLILGSDIADGDLNGDGWVDLVVGSYSSFHPDYPSDAAWIYFGGTEFDTIPDLRLKPSYRCLAWDVCIPGDLNGDGFDDAAISMSHWDDPENHRWTHIFFGGARMDSVADLSFEGVFTGGRWMRLAGGDMNVDGYADLIIGELTNDKDQGRLTVYMGGPDMDTTPDIELIEDGAFGETLAWIGDMTGDGYPEFAVSNPSAAGEIYIYTMGEVGIGDHPAQTPMVGALRVEPNPCRGVTSIAFSMEAEGSAQLGIHDVAGRLVRTISLATHEPGVHRLCWFGRTDRGNPVPDGIYVVSVRAGNWRSAQRIVVIR